MPKKLGRQPTAHEREILARFEIWLDDLQLQRDGMLTFDLAQQNAV